MAGKPGCYENATKFNVGHKKSKKSMKIKKKEKQMKKTYKNFLS